MKKHYCVFSEAIGHVDNDGVQVVRLLCGVGQHTSQAVADARTFLRRHKKVTTYKREYVGRKLL